MALVEKTVAVSITQRALSSYARLLGSVGRCGTTVTAEVAFFSHIGCFIYVLPLLFATINATSTPLSVKLATSTFSVVAAATADDGRIAVR